MRALRSALVSLALSSTGIARGEGVLIYKNQPFHPDNSAHAFRYDRIEGEGFVTWVVVGKERKRFEKTQFHLWVDLPRDLPAEITSPQAIDAITAHRDEIQKTCTRFPNAAPIARKSLELHNEWCKKFAEGMVRHSGQWLTRKEHAELLARREAEAREDGMRAPTQKRGLPKPPPPGVDRSTGPRLVEGSYCFRHVGL